MSWKKLEETGDEMRKCCLLVPALVMKLETFNKLYFPLITLAEDAFLSKCLYNVGGFGLLFYHNPSPGPGQVIKANIQHTTGMSTPYHVFL